MKRLAIRLAFCLFACGLTGAAELPGDLRRKVSDYPLTRMPDGTVFVNCDKAVPAIFGDALRVKCGNSMAWNAAIPVAIIALAERLPKGGAVHLGEHEGAFDLRRIKDGIQVTGGSAGRSSITLGGGQTGIQLMFTKPALNIAPGIGPKGKEPLRDLLAVMCNGPLHIKHRVVDSNWIAAVNGWAVRAVTADAPVDNCLFLWFSYNWTHADYNAHHREPAKNWWKDNAQMHFNCHGGGENTRIYLMIETNYGNPGVGVWLENCKGMHLYHGATERASSRGPGIYYLKNCENVQLGLRRIFPGTRGGSSGVDPTHDVTIEGGKNNTLHLVSAFGDAREATIVNNDRSLQVWGTSADFETKGLDGKGVLRFCLTPHCNRPEDAAAKTADANAEKWAKSFASARARKSGYKDTPENVKKLAALIRTGRSRWWPVNGRHEQTLLFGGTDFTQPIAAPAKAPKLPPPPSIPATNAPVDYRPLYFTQEADFGKALLDAGADPTGKRPSDDAFAKVMYGMTAAQVERDLKAAQRGDKGALDRIHPPKPKDAPGRGPRISKRPPVHLPPGTFLLTKTLHFGAANTTMIGAGPDKSILKFRGDDIVIKHWERGTMASFTVDGGRVGLAVTGIDHHAKGGPFTQSYIAGTNYYNITFRNQTFCGFHTGTDDPAAMGGAEFDQNKFIGLKFYNTGDYGIYMNNNMTDKWLCLGSEFVGQKKAGISIKYNNLIHGGVYQSRFENIDGPGIDFMGGNLLYRFRPYIVMVDQCEFIECGNPEQPAVDYGYGEIMSFTRVKIVTKGKKVKYGYIGAGQHLEDVDIDVDVVDGGAALALRGVRHGATARVNGHILRDVRTTGRVVWLNDANSQNAMFAKTAKALNKAKGKEEYSFGADGVPELDWDCNPAARELAPANGWVHPFLFYRCEIGGKAYDYSLLNVDVDANKVLAEVDLTPYAAK